MDVLNVRFCCPSFSTVVPNDLFLADFWRLAENLKNCIYLARCGWNYIPASKLLTFFLSLGSLPPDNILHIHCKYMIVNLNAQKCGLESNILLPKDIMFYSLLMTSVFVCLPSSVCVLG